MIYKLTLSKEADTRLMVDKTTKQVFYVKNVVKRAENQTQDVFVSTNYDGIAVDESNQASEDQPRRSLNLSGLGWSRHILEQFFVTEKLERRTTIHYDFCQDDANL